MVSKGWENKFKMLAASCLLPFLICPFNVFTNFQSIKIVDKAPFSLSRFKVPVHPGLMIRDEPCHNRGGTVDNLGDPG